MSALNRFLDILSTPDVAMLLILAGMLGLYIEFTQPGMIVPGVVGARLPGSGPRRAPDPPLLLVGV